MRLIDADALDEKLESLKNRYAAQGRTQVADDYNFVQTVLSTAPTIDAVPVVHGRWEEYDQFVCNSDGEPVAKIGIIWRCSKCGRDEDYREPYCHCGAKMDLEDDNG